MKDYTKTGWNSLNENIIHMIGQQWMLVCAGTFAEGFNMMTASWGGMGWLWDQPVAFIFIRPQRFTHEFTEREQFFTLSFFTKKYKAILNKMGSVSGRNFDKMNKSGLTPVETEHGNIAFSEARIVVECKKIYSIELSESGFTEHKIISKIYPKKDFHTMYIGAIVNVWSKNSNDE